MCIAVGLDLSVPVVTSSSRCLPLRTNRHTCICLQRSILGCPTWYSLVVTHRCCVPSFHLLYSDLEVHTYTKRRVFFNQEELAMEWEDRTDCTDKAQYGQVCIQTNILFTWDWWPYPLFPLFSHACSSPHYLSPFSLPLVLAIEIPQSFVQSQDPLLQHLTLCFMCQAMTSDFFNDVTSEAFLHPSGCHP